MLMALGLFVFRLQTFPFQEVKRSTPWRWESKPRVGEGPAWQFCGWAGDSITLDGLLAPEVTGGIDTINILRGMADTGKVWFLVGGNGEVWGKYFIKDVQETRSHLYADGSPRRITFSLQLERYWDDDPAMLGDLKVSKA